MSDYHPEKLFFSNTDLDEGKLTNYTNLALNHLDDGELYLEYKQSDALLLDDNRIKSANYDIEKGFGLRGVVGESTAYAHSSQISDISIKRAIETINNVKAGHSGNIEISPEKTNKKLYSNINPVNEIEFSKKIKVLEDINSYARSNDNLVKQVSASLTSSWQAIKILRADGEIYDDIRPLVRLNVQIVVGDGTRQEVGSYGIGGRSELAEWIKPDLWKKSVNEAIRQAKVNMDSIGAPAGEMTVILGPGWPGILLHEAIGHGLEGDFNRKKTSAFSDLMGKRIAAKGVTVVDDGTIKDRRGSLTIDDEGTPTQCTTLIEDGILTGYIHDRLNARLMGMHPTGNGRRESYAHVPMPRMTNTYMLNGTQKRDELLSSVKNGLYAVNFGGGQVDITSGKFVFSCTEAYEIKNGKIKRPVKGATLIGNGPDILTKISGIGDDMQLDPGVGTCGKNGQGVPVGVGQPSLKIDGLTVGGTNTS
ncbi:MAG: metalloprotease TldD [Rhodospirillaceae bacterium]|nr:metalloprotease TldD [Rhodospirillaceae bacterium]|tara:strand:- start:16138 stop:17571 length:1434 start_codon:yes stop_codon:yes gene_type:complete